MSVRIRVSLFATVVVAIVLALSSVLLLVRQRSGLEEQLSDGLAAEASRLASALDAGDAPQLGADDDDERLVIVLDDERSVVSASGDDEVIDEAIVDLRQLDDDGEVTLDGARYRVELESYSAPGDAEGTVIVAGSLDEVDESVAELRESLLQIVPAASLLLFVVVWLALGRALAPVERIRSKVAAITMAELDRRVPEPKGRDEVARLAATMNDMLGRLETSVRHQQRFVADASHELRTPLTRMRTELEVDDRHPEGADAGATRRSQLEEIAGLQQLIEDLLLLAHGDEGAAQLASQPVDLDDLVFDEARALGAGRVQVDVSRVSAAQVAGDPGQLRRVVRNLIDNAAAHARSHVVVTLGEHDRIARLVIDDDGPGIPPDRREAVFGRFVRLDEARHGSGHSGLGLAIVREIVAMHGGTVHAAASTTGGARFVVELPLR